MTRISAPLPQEIDPDGRVAASLEIVREVLLNLRYGSISLTVHEGQVVQIDVTEKKRLRPA
ncbi:MAG: hypothetical protein RIQ99_133 [Pseudomonadota bacterium]|jgi:hypothetical protein